MMRLTLILILSAFLASCNNGSSTVQSSPQVPTKPSAPENKPSEELLKARAICVRGQALANVASFSVQADDSVFPVNFNIKSESYPLIKLNHFQLMNRLNNESGETLDFAVTGESTAPSQDLSEIPMEMGYLVRANLVHRQPVILSTFEIARHPSEMISVLQEKGYELNPFAIDALNKIKVQGGTPGSWEIFHEEQLVAHYPVNRYFSPRIFDSTVAFFNLQNGRVGISAEDLSTQEKTEIFLPESLGSVKNYYKLEDSWVILSQSLDGYHITRWSSEAQDTQNFASYGKADLFFNKKTQTFTFVGEKNRQLEVQTLKVTDLRKETTQRVSLPGTLQKILSVNGVQSTQIYAVIKSSGVNRFYKLTTGELITVSRSECEKAWVIE